MGTLLKSSISVSTKHPAVLLKQQNTLCVCFVGLQRCWDEDTAFTYAVVTR